MTNKHEQEFDQEHDNADLDLDLDSKQTDKSDIELIDVDYQPNLDATTETETSDDSMFNNPDVNNSINSWLIELYDPIDNTRRLKALEPTDNFSKSLRQLLDTFTNDGYIIPEQLPTSPDPDKTVIKLRHETKSVSREKVVHQTIHYSMVDSTKAPNPIKRKLVFIQNGVKDLVTNEITWDDETQKQSFSEMPSPVKRGYTPDAEIVPEQEITVNNKNFNLSLDKVWLINYQREILTIRIKVIDDDLGDVLKDFVAKGYDGDSLNVTIPELAQEFKKKHYLISHNDLPEKLEFESGQAPTYQVHLVHERGPLKDKTSLKTQGTYTIDFVDKNKNRLRKPIVLTQFYERNAQEDYVTGQIDFEPWSKVGHLPAIKRLPEQITNSEHKILIPLTNKVIIPEIAPNTAEQVEAIYYAPQQMIHLHFKYQNKIVNKMTLKFNLREDHEVNLKKEKATDLAKLGYYFSSEQSAPDTYSYDVAQPDVRTFDINVQPIIKNSTESKIVKRVIIITMPNHAKRSIVHSAVLKRDVTIDLSTKQKTYGEWSTNLWDAYTPPRMKDYLPTQLNVEEVLVNGNTKDTKIHINYVPYNAPEQTTASQPNTVATTKPKTFLEHIKSFFKGEQTEDKQLKIDAPKEQED